MVGTRMGLALAALALGGCTGGSGSPVDPVPCDPVVQDCPYETVAELDYPDGPFGVSVGDVIEPFCFDGYVEPSTGIGEGAVTSICLSDFYNPDGEGIYGPDGSFAEGTTKPRAVFVNVAALWCPPCKEEAALILPGKYTQFAPQGMELVTILTDGPEQGVSATFGDLDSWVTTFHNEYPTVIDPTRQVGSLIDTMQYPANFLIDTTDMTIAEVVVGKPTEAFFAKLENLLE